MKFMINKEGFAGLEVGTEDTVSTIAIRIGSLMESPILVTEECCQNFAVSIDRS